MTAPTDGYDGQTIRVLVKGNLDTVFLKRNNAALFEVRCLQAREGRVKVLDGAVRLPQDELNSAFGEYMQYKRKACPGFAHLKDYRGATSDGHRHPWMHTIKHPRHEPGEPER